MSAEQQIYTISQLNTSVRMCLQQQFGVVYLIGEISNFTRAYSGHLYFSLKDQDAQVRAAMFKHQSKNLVFQPTNGAQVIVKAEVSLYEPRGDYQIIVHEMKLAGAGNLQQLFEALKTKLNEEGLFKIEYKKAIPQHAKVVGIITSSSGAALHDILNILKRRDPSLQIIIYPSLVQGKEAHKQLIKMLTIANQRKECDVLIIGRGGGSLEDLWCFNEEELARAIFASSIPIISAVGHETDITICDFVADLRAPTPSAAAELVSRDQNELLKQLEYQQQMLHMVFDRYLIQIKKYFEQLCLKLQQYQPSSYLALLQQQLLLAQTKLVQQVKRHLSLRAQKFQQLAYALQDYKLQQRLNNHAQQIQANKYRLQHSMQNIMQLQQQQYIGLINKLDSLSPLKILNRGYAIVKDENNHVVTSLKQVKVKQQLYLNISDGRIVTQVITKESTPKKID